MRQFKFKCSRCGFPMDLANLVRVSGLHPLRAMPNADGPAYGVLELCFHCWLAFDMFLLAGARIRINAQPTGEVECA